MDLKLAGKTALVTGSTAGIGLAIAKWFAREGAHVFVTKAVCRNSRRGLVPLFRDKRNERRAPFATLPSRDAETQLGPHLFMSSESGVQIPAEMVHYGMTKTAQIAVARGIAESVAGTGVTVNSILAGPTESEGVSGFVEAMAKHQNKSRKRCRAIFLRRHGLPPC